MTPRQISQTVSVGQNVTFVVTTYVHDLRWRHNGGDVIDDLNEHKTYTITNVTTDDSGIYECHEDNRRSYGEHAIFQLIVRGTQYSQVAVEIE